MLKAETRRLKKLQDVLGEFQDACVAGQMLRDYAEGLPMRSSNRGQLIALGRLIGGQNRQAAMRRADFAGAWERFDSVGGRTGLLARLEESRAPVTAKRTWRSSRAPGRRIERVQRALPTTTSRGRLWNRYPAHREDCRVGFKPR